MKNKVKSFLTEIRYFLRCNWFVAIIFCIFLIGANLLTLVFPEAYFDAQISSYIDGYDISPEDTYVHATFRGNGSNEYINRANQFIDDNKSPALKTYSTYFTKGYGNKYDFNYGEFSASLTIVSLYYRHDSGRTFMETIRLRRHNVEGSNYTKPGLNFNVYISSVLADRVLAQFPRFTSYDDILDAEIEMNVFLHDRVQTVNVCNIFYIENQNPYSKYLYQYLDDFVIASNHTEISRSGDFTVNYDFIPTHSRLKNFCGGPQIESMREDALAIFDYRNPKIANEELAKLVSGSEGIDSSDSIMYIVLGIVFVLPTLAWILFDTLFRKNEFLDNERIKQGCLFFFLAFVQYLVFYIIKFFLTTDTLFFFLRNSLYGAIVIALIALFACLMFLIRIKNKKVFAYVLEI
jgi:hypothetical protein